MKVDHEEGLRNEIEAPAAAKQTQGSIQSTQTNSTTQQANNQGGQGTQPIPVVTSATLPKLSTLDRKVRDYPETLVPWSSPVDMDILTDEMYKFIKRYCVMTDDEIAAIVLWIVSSYLINAFRIFPKLTLISPEKRCGKTTTMELIDSLAKDSLIASNMSPATIYRMTDEYQLSLLIDEADTFLKHGDSELVGIINSSHNKAAATVVRCDGDNYKPKTYSTWMPMVLASIGSLQPTIMDRSIVINLRRMKSTENVSQLPDNLFDANRDLRRKIYRWCVDNNSRIEKSTITPPKVGNDRAADNWMPLFKVAEQIGPSWLLKCETAYRVLTEESEREPSTQALFDIREILLKHKGDKIGSRELIDLLCADNTGPWTEYKAGKKLSSSDLVKLLKPYGIRPKMLRVDGDGKRGYETKQFTDAFERYLP